MLWEDCETVIFTGTWRKALVTGGIVGLNMDGSALFTGGSPMTIIPVAGHPSEDLSIAEKLEVVRDMIRSYQSLEAYLEAMKPKRGDSIDID